MVVRPGILAKIIGRPTFDPYMGKEKEPAYRSTHCSCAEIHLFDVDDTGMDSMSITYGVPWYIWEGAIISVYIWDPKWTYIDGRLRYKGQMMQYGNLRITFYNYVATNMQNC